MRHSFALAVATLALAMPVSAQDDVPIIKTQAASAFVWGEDNFRGVVSSSVRDPVTDNVIRKLEHGGVEVSSRAGFESIRSGEGGELLAFTATIVNNTEAELLVKQGGASVDGRVALPLPVVRSKKGLNKKVRNQVWDLASMNCFSSGFLPNDTVLSSDSSSKPFNVISKRALTVSSVVKDPRHYSVLCSEDGCHPKGTIRFFVTVNATDYVFAWPGRDIVYCGK
jgi:hypothetical protein